MNRNDSQSVQSVAVERDSGSRGASAHGLHVITHDPAALERQWLAPSPGREPVTAQPARDLRWLRILSDGLGHQPYLLEARSTPAAARTDGSVVGQLPLAFVRSRLFGRFLVSLPYVNSGGVEAAGTAGAALVDRAVQLATELDCRFLELRHEERLEHPSLTAELTSKVHMRLPLPPTVGALWDGLKAKVRNQVKKGQQQGFAVAWGGAELLSDFYTVFSRNMRDLGTPVYGRVLFQAILRHFDSSAELCVVRDGRRPIAAGLLVHGAAFTEVPSASSLKSYNPTNANMLLYWHLLSRAIERGQQVFDFGRSTADGPVFRFKKQWGAEPSPAVWQYHVRHGSIDAARPDNPRHQRLIRLWKRLPLWCSRILGPRIVRGIP